MSSLRGFGGGEEWFLSATALLLERGHQVCLAVRRGSALEAAAHERALPVEGLAMGGEADPRTLVALARLLEVGRFEVALSNLDKELRLLALASLARRQVALVPRRGSEIPLRNTFLNRWLYGRRVARVLVNSPSLASLITRTLPALDPAKVVVLPNGVDPVELGPAERPELEALWPAGKGARLIAVGEVSERKNQAGLVRALARVAGPWRLLVCGDGPALPAVRAEAERLGLAERVRFLGHVPGARRLTAAADCLVHFSSSEGQPWAVLEALVAGVPVVATALPGLAEVLLDGVTGSAVPPGDEAALAAALAAVLADPAAAGRRALEGRRRVGASHSAEALGDRLERVLEAARLTSLPRPLGAVFLDRDGTLTPELGYLGEAERLRLLPGVGAGLRILDRAGFPLVLVTNQSAIGRGLHSAAEVRAVHARLRALCRAESVELAGIYVCPHAPEAGCACRKPAPGLVEQAIAELGLARTACWLIGDAPKDVEAARRAGVRPVLVETGHGGREETPATVRRGAEAAAGEIAGVPRAPDLARAAAWIAAGR